MYMPCRLPVWIERLNFAMLFYSVIVAFFKTVFSRVTILASDRTEKISSIGLFCTDPSEFFCTEPWQKMQNHWIFSSNNICIWQCQKAWWDKKEDEQTFQLITCRLVQTSYIKRILNFSCLPYNKHGRSVWEESWPRIVSTDSVLTISAKTRDLTQNTTATTTRTSRNKRFEEQNNSCARAF